MNYGNQMTGTAQTAGGPVMETELAHVAFSLGGNLNRLEARLAALQERLSPVLQERSQLNQATPKASRALTSPLGRDLMEISNRIEAAEERLTVILDTLAV